VSLIVKRTSRFIKDVQRLTAQNKDLRLLEEVVTKLAAGEVLAPEYRDHKLKGEFNMFRECHVAPDWLLIYYVDVKVLVLTLSRTGSHSTLFKK
jgi:mRNA interferase YafQ